VFSIVITDCFLAHEYENSNSAENNDDFDWKLHKFLDKLAIQLIFNRLEEEQTSSRARGLVNVRKMMIFIINMAIIVENIIIGQ
jgi:hypothetical protein